MIHFSEIPGCAVYFLRDKSSFSPVNCCSRLWRGVRGRCVSSARSFGIEKKNTVRWRGTENAGVEAEISLSALRYPTFPDVAKQNGGHTRQALPDSRSRLLFHHVSVRPLTLSPSSSPARFN